MRQENVNLKVIDKARSAKNEDLEKEVVQLKSELHYYIQKE